jgi:TolB protein
MKDHRPPRTPLALVLSLLFAGAQAGRAQPALRDQLKALPFKLAYETYVDGNWEIFVVNADGSNPVNLTRSPQVHEHYPQVSPDGTHIADSVDSGQSRDTVRSLWIMNSDGSQPRHLVDGAREPFWSPDSKSIGFLPQEFPKFHVIDYSTKGMSFYRLDTGRVEPHPNSAQLHHLYNPAFAPNGRWIAATVHAGMGFDHAILLIEANGPRILNLKIPGCRPCFSPDGKQIAWGAGDHEIVAAPIDLDADTPRVGEWRLRISDAKEKTYHVDWSPDSRFLAISRGPEGEGDPNQPGTFTAACEIVGVYAPGWNLLVVPATLNGKLDLLRATPADLAPLTTNGLSNKESAWFKPPSGRD